MTLLTRCVIIIAGFLLALMALFPLSFAAEPATTHAESPTVSQDMPAESGEQSVEVSPSPDLYRRPISRLNSLVRQKPTVYLPTRLILGESTNFVIKAQPGTHIALYVSPEDVGYAAPNGKPLRVGQTNEELKGDVPENGVLTLTLPIPQDPNLDGRAVFVEAIAWTRDDYRDLEVVTLMEATGRPAVRNMLAIAAPSDSGKGVNLMPSMPGMPQQLIQNMASVAGAQGDEDKKQMIDRGTRDTDLLYDRNSFLARPNSMVGTP